MNQNAQIPSKLNSDSVWGLAGIDEPIILASSSPRRAEILSSIGCPFEVVPSDIQEEKYIQWDGGELLQSSAVQKARDVAQNQIGRKILGADTVVRLGDQVFGKPGSIIEAAATLKTLSGETHEVWTAICIISGEEQKIITGISSTAVTFCTLSQEEISAYTATDEPMDKAGSYGIQGIGGVWVRNINGCYFNVVGLPVSLFWELLMTMKGC